MLGSSGEWKSSPREINGGSEAFPSHSPQQSFSSHIEWPLSIHTPRLKWTVLNPESAWREGNGDYLPGETGREMKGVGASGRKRENERKEGGRCKKRGLRTLEALVREKISGLVPATAAVYTPLPR
ncbi:hypothetical protein ABG768_018109 [Culter alburnus]|uniref:Uncharacterized protein n=1 Tax=Culter alburnus TaxID=194366 RepID=A0AAW1YUQ4_CULAL